VHSVTTDDFGVYYKGLGINEKEFTDVIKKDLLWAFLSIVCILVFMIIYMEAIFTAMMGMVSIFLSFPIAFFFYRIVFGFTTVGALHITSL
jgi:hypothetical protein